MACSRADDPARGYIISTIFFVSGLVTLLQTTIGCRLPIVQVKLIANSSWKQTYIKIEL